MGSQISALVVEPILGIGITGLGALGIVKQKEKDVNSAMWAVIGAICLIVLLIITNFTLLM